MLRIFGLPDAVCRAHTPWARSFARENVDAKPRGGKSFGGKEKTKNRVPTPEINFEISVLQGLICWEGRTTVEDSITLI